MHAAVTCACARTSSRPMTNWCERRPSCAKSFARAARTRNSQDRATRTDTACRGGAACRTVAPPTVWTGLCAARNDAYQNDQRPDENRRERDADDDDLIRLDRNRIAPHRVAFPDAEKAP